MFRMTSTYSMNAALRQSLGLLQANLARGQKELTTGRHADMLSTLGPRTRATFTLASTRETVNSTLSTNRLVAARLDTSQSILTSLSTDAQNVRKALVAAQTDGGEPGAIALQTRQALVTMISKLNSSDGDGFLFAGIKVDQQPVAHYFSTPESPGKTAVDSAFLAAFGFSQTDPAVSTITESQIQNFLAGPFQSLFDADSWKANWSQASDEPVRSHIDSSITIDSSVTANEPALQKLAAAYVMVSDLGAARMSRDAYTAVLKAAADTLSDGIDLLTRTQAKVGVMQSSVKTATAMMSLQSETLLIQLDDLESVDPTEAATRVNDLMTKIETAYTLTSRITQLSLTKYL